MNFFHRLVVSLLIFLVFTFSTLFVPVRVSAGFPVSIVGDLLEQVLNAIGVVMIEKVQLAVMQQVAQWAAEQTGPLGQAFIGDFSNFFVDLGKIKVSDELKHISRAVGNNIRAKKEKQVVNAGGQGGQGGGAAGHPLAQGASGAQGGAAQDEDEENSRFVRIAAQTALRDLRARYEDYQGYIGTDNFRVRAGCSQDQFYQGNESCDGWAAWLALGDPQNNPIGVSMDLEKHLVQSEQHEVGSAKQETQSESVLGKKRCIKKDEEGKCRKYVNVTPGTLVASHLANTLNLTNQSLASKDELIETVAIIVGHVVSSVLSNNLFDDFLTHNGSSFSDADTIFDDSAGSYTDYSVPRVVLDTDGNEVRTGRTDFVYILGVELESHIATLDDADDTSLDLANNRIKQKIYELDVCLPGPDRGWGKRLSNISSCSNSDDSDEDECGWVQSEKSAIASKMTDTELNVPNIEKLIKFRDGMIKKYTTSQFEADAREQNESTGFNPGNELAIMRGIKSDVHALADPDFIPKSWEYKQFILYPEDWNKLDPTQQSNIATQNNVTYDQSSKELPSGLTDKYWDIWSNNVSEKRQGELVNRFNFNRSSEIMRDAYLETMVTFNAEATEDLKQIGRVLDDCKVMRDIVAEHGDDAALVMNYEAGRIKRGDSKFQTSYFVTNLYHSIFQSGTKNLRKVFEVDDGKAKKGNIFLCAYTLPEPNDDEQQVVDKCKNISGALDKEFCQEKKSVSRSCNNTKWYRAASAFEYKKEFIDDSSTSGGGSGGCNALLAAAGECEL